MWLSCSLSPLSSQVLPFGTPIAAFDCSHCCHIQLHCGPAHILYCVPHIRSCLRKLPLLSHCSKCCFIELSLLLSAAPVAVFKCSQCCLCCLIVALHSCHCALQCVIAAFNSCHGCDSLTLVLSCMLPLLQSPSSLPPEHNAIVDILLDHEAHEPHTICPPVKCSTIIFTVGMHCHCPMHSSSILLECLQQ